MAKIIKLNENDLKRIVVKVLNERQEIIGKQPLNEFVGILIGAAVIAAAGSAGYMKWMYQSPADKAMEKLHKGCQDPDSIIGKPMMSKQQHIQIASEVGDAIAGSDITGQGEEDLSSALSRIKSIPDYCKVAEEYEIQHGEDMYEAIDGDINLGGWDEYVRQPLSKAIRTTDEANKNAEGLVDTEDSKKGGAGEEEEEEEKEVEIQKDNWGMFMCVIEHPKSVADKFQNGERTRFRIGQTYYMGNGMKLYKGIEVPYSCDDKEFRNVDFENKEKSDERRNSVDADMVNIQGFLTDEGYDISNDGKIGPETAGAIIDYIADGKEGSDEFKPSSVLELQKKINSCYSKKIKEDGKVGPETLNAIADALESAQDGDLC